MKESNKSEDLGNSCSPLSLTGGTNCSLWDDWHGNTARGSQITDVISCPMSSSGITWDADARLKAIITLGGGDSKIKTKSQLLIGQALVNRACARFPSRNANVAKQPRTCNIVG